MSDDELQEIVNEVLSDLQTHAKTIEQLPVVSDATDVDYIELNGGRRISVARLAAFVNAKVSAEIAGKANLNSQSVLATGEEQRVVIHVVRYSDKPVIISTPGVYFNENTNKIETWKLVESGAADVNKCVLSESPSENVMYCDADANTILRWNGSAMIEIMGGKPSTEEAYTKAESDAMFRNKVSKAGDKMDGDLAFTLGNGIVLSDESGNTSTLYQDEEDDCPRMATKNGDKFLFKHESDPKVGSEAIVSSEDLFKGVSVVLASMGVTLDNVGNDDTIIMIQPSVGDIFYDAGSRQIYYQKTDTEAVGLGAPSNKRIYCNAVTGILYAWKGNNWAQVGGDKIDAYTKAESEVRYAKLDSSSQTIKAHAINADIVNASVDFGVDGYIHDSKGDSYALPSNENTVDADYVFAITEDIDNVTKSIEQTKEDIAVDIQRLDANAAYTFFGNAIDFSLSDHTLSTNDIKMMQGLVGRLISANNGNTIYATEAVFAGGVFDGAPDGLITGYFTVRSTMCYVDTDMGRLHFMFCVAGTNYHMYTENTVSATDTGYKFKLVKF